MGFKKTGNYSAERDTELFPGASATSVEVLPARQQFSGSV